MALNHKLQTFVDVFDGDANKAADIAGISQQYGRRLVMDSVAAGIQPKCLEVQEAIKQRQATEQRGTIADRAERQRFWTDIQRGKLTDVVIFDGVEVDCRESTLAVRMKASELLGKSELDFGERRQTDASDELKQFIAWLEGREMPLEAQTLPEAPIEQAQAIEDSTDDRTV